MDNTTYEFFIRRCWKCDRFQHGADTDEWDGLLRDKWHYDNSKTEKEKVKAKQIYEKRFAKVKTYITKASNKLLTRAQKEVKDTGVIDQILDLVNGANASKSPNDLWNILRRGFTILNDNKF